MSSVRIAAGQANGNIQGIPTPWIYVNNGPKSSYDNFSAYTVGVNLTGLNGWETASLGCKFARPYVNHITVPWVTWDTFTNAGYTVGADLISLNGGDNNNFSRIVYWTNFYQYGASQTNGTPTTSYTGVFTVFNLPGFQTLYITFDGSTPDPNASHGPGVKSLAWSSVPAGTWNWEGPMFLPIGCVIKVLAGRFGNQQSQIATGSFLSCGNNWSSNVVVNGGSAPAGANVTAIDTMAIGLNNGANSPIFDANGANLPSIVQFNVYAPDSLTAALTPIVYFYGNVLYVNHNFVGGDLGVNGLTGNAATPKYLDTGFAPQIYGSFQGFSAYVYNAAGTGSDAGSYDGTHIMEFDANNAGNSRDFNGVVGNQIVTGAAGNGFFTGTRTSATVHKFYFANSGSAWAQIGATETTSFSAAQSTANFFVFTLSNGGAPLASCSDTISITVNHFGLTSAQGQQLFNAVQAVRTAFGGGFR